MKNLKTFPVTQMHSVHVLVEYIIFVVLMYSSVFKVFLYKRPEPAN